MDLSLFIGPPRSHRRRGGLDPGSPIPLGSPAAPPTSSASASSSSSTEGPPAAADAYTPPAPGATCQSPHSPLHPLFADDPDDISPISGRGDAPVSASSPPSPPYVPPPLPDGPPEEPLAGDGSAAGADSSHLPSSPPYSPFSPTPAAGAHGHATFPPCRLVTAPMGSNLSDGDGVSPLSDLSESEFRMRMLIELLRRRRRRRRSIRRFQSAVSSIHNTTEELVHIMRRSGEGGEDTGKKGAGVARVSDGDLEEGMRDGGSAAADFECNICLEIAKEPVVTCCGHLFCWPCLHQWLHLYCSHRECPVCKGEVEESSITPIYGRGSTETTAAEEEGDVGGSGLRIPPRPCGRRAESWRQGIPRPVSRRFVGGLTGSWRYLFGEQFWSRSRGTAAAAAAAAAAEWVPDLQENVDDAHNRGFSGLRTRGGLMRMGEELENGYYSGIEHAETAGDATQNGVSASLDNQHGVNWDWFPRNSSDHSRRLSAFTARLSRIFGRSASSSSRSGGPALSANPQNPDDPSARPPDGSSQGVDQFSTSSTMAVIQDDAEVANLTTEPNSVGSSSSLRRRGRSSFSGSLDVDGCLLHACKRRRLN